jgi:hypothetical protein
MPPRCANPIGRRARRAAAAAQAPPGIRRASSTGRAYVQIQHATAAPAASIASTRSRRNSAVAGAAGFQPS